MDYDTLFAWAATQPPHPAGAGHVVEGICLGLPVRIACDSARLATLVTDIIGPGRTTGAVCAVVAAHVTDTYAETLDGPLRHRDDVHYRLFAGAGTAGRVDFAARRAVAQLDPRLLDAPLLLREVLLAYLLSLLTRHDRTPVHAAAVGRGDTGIILAARGGTGKSTLAYACAQAGLRVLSDDAVFVQLTPSLHVHAPRGPIHLNEDARAWFDELTHATTELRASGKRKLAVEVIRNDDRPFTRTALCVLRRRGAAQPHLHALHVSEALAEVGAALDAGFDVFQSTIDDVLRALAHGGAWRLDLSDDPRDAVPLIVALLDRISPQSAPQDPPAP